MLPRGGGRPPSGDPRRPIPIPRSREEEPRLRAREPVRRHEDEYTRRVRPSTLQKMIKNFDGSGDPHDHVASFKQVVQAMQELGVDISQEIPLLVESYGLGYGGQHFLEMLKSILRGVINVNEQNHQS